MIDTGYNATLPYKAPSGIYNTVLSGGDSPVHREKKLVFDIPIEDSMCRVVLSPGDKNLGEKIYDAMTVHRLALDSAANMADMACISKKAVTAQTETVKPDIPEAQLTATAETKAEAETNEPSFFSSLAHSKFGKVLTTALAVGGLCAALSGCAIMPNGAGGFDIYPAAPVPAYTYPIYPGPIYQGPIYQRPIYQVPMFRPVPLFRPAPFSHPGHWGGGFHQFHR